MTDLAPDPVRAVREFNRFYTRTIGVLGEHLLESPFSLTEARILFEVAHKPAITGVEIGQLLGVNQGYVSRVLARLERQRLIRRDRTDPDGRRRAIQLTESGKFAANELDRQAREQVSTLLEPLADRGATRLLVAMESISNLLGASPPRQRTLTLRTHQPGDIGWIVERHGALYAQEYDWNDEFEALVAEICAAFLRSFDEERERCWIAEMDGARVGSIMCVRGDETTAKLRLLLVEPSARGHGVGKALVDECIAFARTTGYQSLTLWTNSVLVEARTIYERRGFVLVSSEPHRSFGHDLVGQYWRLPLAG